MSDPLSAGPDETLDRLSRSLRILQRRKGHRATTDDVLLAWAGTRACPDASRILDLGTGKGTVALLMARALPLSRIIGVEAFAESHALGVRNVALNGLDDRISFVHGDLRDPGVIDSAQTFDLITGAPPFMPLGTGILPSDPQRASGRFELRGGVEGYAHTAARALAPDGRAVLLMDGHSRDRTRAAIDAAGLSVEHLLAIKPRPGRPPTYWIATATHDAPSTPLETELVMRDATGDAWSTAYRAVRRALDLD